MHVLGRKYNDQEVEISSRPIFSENTCKQRFFTNSLERGIMLTN